MASTTKIRSRRIEEKQVFDKEKSISSKQEVRLNLSEPTKTKQKPKDQVQQYLCKDAKGAPSTADEAWVILDKSLNEVAKTHLNQK